MTIIRNIQRRTRVRRWLHSESQQSPLQYPEQANDMIRKIFEGKINKLRILKKARENEILVLNKSNKELKQSNDFYVDLFDNAPVGYFLLSNDESILQVNQAGSTLLGIERTNLANELFTRFINPESRQIWEIFIQNVQNHQDPQICTLELECSNGTMVFTRIEGVRKKTTGGDVLIRLGVINISDLMVPEKILRNDGDTYKILFDNLEIGVIYQNSDSTLIGSNPSALTLLGLTSEEFMSRSSMNPRWEFIHTDETPFPSEEYPSTRALLSGKPVKNVIAGVFNHQISKYIWLSIDAIPLFKPDMVEPYQVVITLQDVSTEKKAIDLIYKKKHFLRKILRSTPGLIYVQNMVDNRITFMNKEVSDFLGHSYEQPKGTIISIFDSYLHPDDRQKVSDHYDLMKTVKDGSVLVCEYRIAHPDGSWRIIQSSDVVFSRDSIGNVIEILGFAVVIIPHPETDDPEKAALFDSKDSLREIHHQIKNSMATILSLINLQGASLSSKGEISHFQDLEARIRSIALVQEFVDLQSKTSGISAFDYTSLLVKNLLQIYNPRPDIRFQYTFDPIILPRNIAVPYGLVMNEIITNALKYAFPLDSPGEPEEKPQYLISISMKMHESRLEWKISDNGKGMSPEIARSHQTLGLHLIFFIVSHQLGGTVEVNTVGGAQYLITIPNFRNTGDENLQ